MTFKITSEFLLLLQQKIEDLDNEWIKKNILELHYADIAEIMDCLDNSQAKYIYELADDDTQSDILMEVDEKVRDEFLASLSNKEIAEQLENLESDDAADLLGELPDDQQEDVISKMDDDEAAEVVDLLKYDEDTAGGVMQKELICVNLNWPVNRAIVQLRKQAETVEKVYHIYVVDNDERFVGVLSLKRLLFAGTKTIISDLYQAKNLISVKSSDSLETVSKIMEKYDLFTIPVLDLQNKLIGRITFDDVVEFIKEEADKDYQMASGLSEKVDSYSSVWKISRARLPWLLIGMVGGVFGAQVISGFEGGIEKVPELAFYIPLIMAMGGNIGVQSSAIVVQSLAKDSNPLGSIFKKIARESIVALINGAFLSILIFAIAFAFGNSTLGFVVSISLFAVILVAAIFGTLIPLLLNKYKIDPALATGPFITTLNDVVGLFIYFTIGMMMYNL